MTTPISPALAGLTAEQRAEVSTVVENLNNQLDNHFVDKQSGFEWPYDAHKDLSKKVRAGVTGIYRQVGWEVNHDIGGGFNFSKR